MEFYKQGKKVEVKPIFNNGRVGQIIVLTNVSLDPEFTLSRYAQPSFFVIREIKEDGYLITDDEGISRNLSFRTAWFIYPAKEWTSWNMEREQEELRKKEGHIKTLTGKLELLKGILIAQGMRYVTKEQAKQFDLDEIK
jgi:hypothetical protein